MCKSKMLIEHDQYVYLTNKYGKTKIFYQTTPEHLMIIHGHKKGKKPFKTRSTLISKG